MEDNKVIHAKLVSANRDIMGELESFVIKDESGKKRLVTLQQVEAALKNGVIEIKGLKLTSRGNVKRQKEPPLGRKKIHNVRN